MKREDAIAELKRFSGTTRIRLSANFWEALNMSIKALEQEPKIVPLAEIKFDDDMLHEIVEEAVKNIEIEPKWIPVNERLPEDDGTYIVSGKWGSGKISVGECEYYKHDEYFRTAWNFYVIAWMPMPAPYKAESEE